MTIKPTLPEWMPGNVTAAGYRYNHGSRPFVTPTPNTQVQEACIANRRLGRADRWARNHKPDSTPPRHIFEKGSGA